MLGVVSTQSFDEIFAACWDLSPNAVCEANGALLDSFHDLLICVTVEWGLAAEGDESYDAARPYVALLCVLTVYYLWSDVVASSYPLRVLLLRLECDCCAKVDQLDMIEIFVLFQEDVLWLEVPKSQMKWWSHLPVHGLVLMTVVDALKHLLHEYSAVFLCEFASLDYFIEQLTTFAYPNQLFKSWTYSVTM